MLTVKQCVPFYFFVCAAVLFGAVLLSKVSGVLPLPAAATGMEPTIVIDAGHGGEDGGAVSLSGIYESRLNLEIAQRLDVLLRFLGKETKMIRTADVSVYTQGETLAQKKVSDLRERVRIVSETPNPILVSIHQNHFSQSQYRGAQVFYAPGSDALAEAVQQGIALGVDEKNHRVCKEAENIFLLEQVSCPAILIECGFLSNPVEEQLLTQEHYQKKLAAAIACSLLTYTEDMHEV